jgi:uncharacterized membrane protein SpoIIM required for sporulation
MVLEKIITLREALRNPLQLFIASSLISIVSLIISILVFPRAIGLFTTFLITLALAPFMLNLVKYEEAKEEELIAKRKEVNLLQFHKNALILYAVFFAGISLTYSIIFIMLPESVVERIFYEQLEEIKLIRGEFVGTFEKFSMIILNNLGVFILAFLLSLLFGVGAIFVLTWNATILASAIGIVAKNFGGIKGLPIGILTFLPHGIFEITAYFIAALAGGILSSALTKRHSRFLKKIFQDTLWFLFFGIICLLIGAIIEVGLIML